MLNIGQREEDVLKNINIRRLIALAIQALAPAGMDSYALLRCLPKKRWHLKNSWQKSAWQSGISNSGFKTDKFDVINDVVEDIELQDSYKR